MNTKDHLKAVEGFLDWVENCTNYEIGVDEQSDWGDGESNFHMISFEEIFNQYKQLVLTDI